MNKPLVVIIEDDVEINNIFRLTLQSEFETASFQDGATALDRLQHLTPALIILDLNMPEVSGADILKFVKNDERLSATPIILATADALSAAALEDSVDLVLIKPISPLQLRSLAMRINLFHP